MSDQFVTKDSGRRADFSTGAVRDTVEGKGRYDLLPWLALRRVAQLYQRGAEKYADRNWEKGIPNSRMLDSCIRHAAQYAEGDRSEDHAAAIVFNALGLIFNEEMVARGLRPAELLDLPSYQPKPAEEPKPVPIGVVVGTGQPVASADGGKTVTVLLGKGRFDFTAPKGNDPDVGKSWQGSECRVIGRDGVGRPVYRDCRRDARWQYTVDPDEAVGIVGPYPGIDAVPVDYGGKTYAPGDYIPAKGIYRGRGPFTCDAYIHDVEGRWQVIPLDDAL